MHLQVVFWTKSSPKKFIRSKKNFIKPLYFCSKISFEIFNKLFENILKMLCSLCLKQKNKCIQLPCNHIICYSCLPKQSFNQNVFRYQCETCLSCHQIDLTEQNKIEANNFKEYSAHSQKNSESDHESQCVFCWTCHEAITLRQYIKGHHHDHSVETYEQALPSIKNLLMDQLQKSLRMKQQLEQNKQKLENNNLKQCYQNLVDKINDFFHSQMQLINRKRESVLQEVQRFYSNSLAQLQKSINTLAPLIEEIQSTQAKISHFLSDQLPITEINPISDVIFTIDEYTKNLKSKAFFIPQLPQFIPKSNLKDSISQSCSLFFNKKVHERKASVLPDTKDRSTKLRNGFAGFQASMDTKIERRDQIKIGFKRRQSQVDTQNEERKVKLVEKVKVKMRYSSSMCSTGYA